MNTMKKNGGFTLVELIIVIAILAILSTGAIAGYSAYIQSANDTAVEAVLSDIQTSAVLANAAAGAIDSIDVTVNGTTLTVKINAVDDNWDTNTESGFVKMMEKSLKATGSISDNTYTGTITVKSKSWTSSVYKNGATWSVAEGWKEK